MPLHRPPKGWPKQGAISVQALEVRYRADQPTVLRGLTFQVSGAQHSSMHIGQGLRPCALL